MSLSYFAGDELPAWVATISHNGTPPDFSTGWTFQVIVTARDASVPALTKTTNIAGAAAGVVTVTWAANDLALTPGTYLVQLKATRAADSLESTIEDVLTVKRRY